MSEVFVNKTFYVNCRHFTRLSGVVTLILSALTRFCVLVFLRQKVRQYKFLRFSHVWDIYNAYPFSPFSACINQEGYDQEFPYIPPGINDALKTGKCSTIHYISKKEIWKQLRCFKPLEPGRIKISAKIVILITITK